MPTYPLVDPPGRLWYIDHPAGTDGPYRSELMASQRAAALAERGSRVRVYSADDLGAPTCPMCCRLAPYRCAEHPARPAALFAGLLALSR